MSFTFQNTTLPTISALTASQLQSITSPSSIFDLNFHLNPNVKKYEIYELDEDALALSVTWKRMRDSGSGGVCTRITDQILFKNITQEDRNNADLMADYYSKKIMMLKLLGNDNNLSLYRKDLNEFVHSDRKKLTDKYFGLAYYLPMFYEYDLDLDGVKSTLINNTEFKKDSKIYIGSDVKTMLTPVKRLFRKTKNTSVFHYWLKTSNNVGVLIAVQPNNSLIKLWEYFFNQNKEICIQGDFTPKSIDNFEYLSAKNWHVVHS